MYENDQRTVLTLDAGGTNFVFSAIQRCQEVVRPLTLPSQAHSLPLCLETMRQGFQNILDQLRQKGLQAVAISFAFPGPADYTRGIIMDLNNMPAFRGGVPLKAFLEAQFHLPVFINNDADMFTFGECMAGALPETNRRLAQAGCPKQFRNLIGFTFGTGFGCGITHNGQLYVGDNSSAGEILLLRHRYQHEIIVEEGVSIRAVQRVYHEHCNDSRELSPLDILHIAEGSLTGDRKAALKSFEEFGAVAADGIAQAMTLLDGLIVLGGGLCGNRKYFLPAMMRELNGKIATLDGTKDRLEMKVYNLDDEEGFKAFCTNTVQQIPVPGTDRTVDYDPVKRTGLVFSKLGTSRATAIGAYTFALSHLD
ncbi:MAG: ROK family protein [Bacteroidales bacterium]|nr:ROK family protein [Bacteroidales bacterium]